MCCRSSCSSSWAKVEASEGVPISLRARLANEDACTGGHTTPLCCIHTPFEHTLTLYACDMLQRRIALSSTVSLHHQLSQGAIVSGVTIYVRQLPKISVAPQNGTQGAPVRCCGPGFDPKQKGSLHVHVRRKQELVPRCLFRQPRFVAVQLVL